MFAPMITDDTMRIGFQDRRQHSWLSMSKSIAPGCNGWLLASIRESCLSWTKNLQNDEAASFRLTPQLQWEETFQETSIFSQLAILDQDIRHQYLNIALQTAGQLLVIIDSEEHAVRPQLNLILPGEIETVAALLTLRIVLYAAILSRCPDTSFRFDPGFRDSIVKIL
jgi:hypothetical protein